MQRSGTFGIYILKDCSDRLKICLSQWGLRDDKGLLASTLWNITSSTELKIKNSLVV